MHRWAAWTVEPGHLDCYPDPPLPVGGTWACFCCFCFSNVFIEVQLIYNVALISAVRQSDSIIYISLYICTHSVHTHTQSSYILFHHCLAIEYWILFSVLYSRTLLLIHPIYNSFFNVFYWSTVDLRCVFCCTAKQFSYIYIIYILYIYVPFCTHTHILSIFFSIMV